MGFDEEYLEELLNEIDAIVNPESLNPGDGYGIGMPQEEEGFVSAVPEETEDIGEPESEAVSYEEVSTEPESVYQDITFEVDENVAEQIKALTGDEEPKAEENKISIGDLELDPEDGNKILSREEIDAMFAAVNGGGAATESASENDIFGDLDMSVSEDEGSDSVMNLSDTEIDAILDAAKSSENDVSELPGEDADLMELLAMSGESDLSDIQNILQSDDNGEALDVDAFMNAMATPDVASDIFEEPEGKKKGKKKKGKKSKKSKNKELEITDELADIPEKKKGFFTKVIELLTEPVDEEEAQEVSMNDIGIASDENREILEELDREKGKKKKGKKSKKSKKDKKNKEDGKEAASDSIEDIPEKSPDEVEIDKKKKKKKKKKEKVKKVKEKAPEEPSKRLPRKRVRVTFILCISIMIAILVFMFLLTRIVNLSDARWAFDNQDYETTYENLYGLDLGDDDAEIYKKSKLILLVDRKYKSYQNYMNLGMKVEAVGALFDAVSEYPMIRESAVANGIEAQTDYTYSLILAALSEFGISEQEAREIIAYESKVRYTLKIQSIANGTPYTYDDEIAAYAYQPENVEQEALAEEQPEQVVEDILPEEMDILPDDPNSIFTDYGVQNYDMNVETFTEENGEPQVIDAEVEVNW